MLGGSSSGVVGVVGVVGSVGTVSGFVGTVSVVVVSVSVSVVGGSTGVVLVSVSVSSSQLGAALVHELEQPVEALLQGVAHVLVHVARQAVDGVLNRLRVGIA